MFDCLMLFIDYVEEIYQTYLTASKDDISDAAKKLQEMTPAPMNSMLEKQPKEDAIEKRDKRNRMVVADVPPTTPGSYYKIYFLSKKSELLCVFLLCNILIIFLIFQTAKIFLSLHA